MNRRLGYAGVFCSLLLGGCLSVPEGGGFADVQKLAGDRLEQQLHWRLGTPEDAQVDQAVARLLLEEVSPEGAVQVALLRNATLQATYERLGVAQVELVQAGVLDNPVFSGFVRFPDRSPSKTNLEFEVALNFLDVLMLPVRKRLATTTFEEVKLQVAQQVLEMATDVRKAYFQAVSAENVVRMRRLVAEAAQASYLMATRIHAAGNLSDLQLDVEHDAFERARVTLAHSELAAKNTREQLTRLLGLWGKDVGYKLPSRLPEISAQEVPLDHLESFAVANRLDLAASRQEVEAAAQILGVAIDWRWLGGTGLGVSTERDSDGQWLAGPTFEINLPLFGQQQAEIAKHQAVLRQSQQRLVALAVEARSEVRELRDRLLMLRNVATHYRQVVLPLRERIVTLRMKEYNYMLAGVFDVLLARQSEYDAYQEYLETIRDYWMTRAELQLALGGRLPTVAPSPLEDLFKSGQSPPPPTHGEPYAKPS